jgi:predicted phosphate transport protein (TIGR00153 family)
LSNSLLSWIAKRRNEKILEMMDKHLELTTGTLDKLIDSYRLKVKGIEEEAKKSITEIKTMEKEADEIRRKIAIELTKSDIPPSERTDLMHLNRRLDMITDWVNGAARILAIIQLNNVSKALTNLGMEMVELARDCAYSVKKCLNKLLKDVKDALDSADEVERLEEKIDEKYLEVRKMYSSLEEPNVKASEAILITQFFDAVEQAADSCENTIDLIRVIAVRIT